MSDSDPMVVHKRCDLCGQPTKFTTTIAVAVCSAPCPKCGMVRIFDSPKTGWMEVPEFGIPYEYESKQVLAYSEGRILIAFQTTSNEWCEDGIVLKKRPTHWRELPEAPE